MTGPRRDAVHIQPHARDIALVRGWVREVLSLLYILHNRRLLGMLDSFRHNAPLRR
jgi:hypothetical protein